MFTPPSTPSYIPSPQRTALNGVAHEYQQAAGVSFARGDDAEAKAFRDFAAELTALVNRMPEIPVRKRR